MESPSAILGILKAGNRRFIAGKSTFPNLSLDRRRETTSSGQKPKAIILTCADSRTPPEYIFDQGIGDLFIVRNAGNVCDQTTIASVELGVGLGGASLIVVLGHRDCGAVSMAVKGNEVSPVVKYVIDRILPAAVAAREKFPELSEYDLIQQAAKENALNSLREIIAESPLIQDKIRTGEVMALAAFYDIESGEVEWL